MRVSDENAFVFVNNHDNQRGHGGGGGIVTFEDPHGLKAIGIKFSLTVEVLRFFFL